MTRVNQYSTSGVLLQDGGSLNYLSDHLTKRNLGLAFVIKQHKSLQKLPKNFNQFPASCKWHGSWWGQISYGGVHSGRTPPPAGDGAG